MTNQLLRLDRPFHWGVMFLFDDSAEWPFDAVPSVSEPVIIQPAGVVIAVRHGADVAELDEEGPVQVTVEVKFGSPSEPTGFQGSVTVPSGVVTIGDAERWDDVVVEPGMYAVRVLLVPVEHAEQVTVWLEYQG